LARAGDDGQCVFIGGEGAEPLTNSYCRAAPGGLISDGEIPLLWTQFDLEQRFIRMDESVTECTQRVGVWSPYDFDDTKATFFSVLGLEQTALLSLPRYNGLQPIIGRRMTPLPGDDGGVGETTLDLLAYGQWWSSPADADWRPENDTDPAACDAEAESGWPYPKTRALAAFRPLPTGCPDAEGCVLDTMNAVLFEFEDTGPTLRYLPLVERSPNGVLAGLESEEGCEPSPEVCDGQDNDCDGRIDDGTCCIEDTPVISFDFPEVLPEGSTHPTGAVQQWMVTTDENAREYWIFYRSEIPAAAEGAEDESPGDVVWDGFKMPEGREDPPRDPAPFRRGADNPRMSHAYFGQGVMAIPSGGRLALLVRDADGVLHLVWHHHEPVKAPIPLPPACQDYMALGVLRIDGQRESVFLACRDRMVRYYYNPDRLDLTYFWGPDCPGEDGCDATHTALGLVESGEIDWATITQHPLSSDPLSPSAAVKWDNEFFMMVGYTDLSSGMPSPALASYEISYRHDAECDDARFMPCVDHCAVAYESDYCGRTADQNFDPRDPTRRPGWIGDDDQLEVDWRACGAEAVTAKTTCCEALFDRVLRETDVVAEERREANVTECVEEMVKGNVPAWINAANGAGVTDYVHEGWNPCFDEMRAAKIRCCFALDDSQLDCHRPHEMPLPALLDRYASSYPEANYTHPFWVAPSKTRTRQLRAVRALPLGDAGGESPPRFELARRGLRDDNEVPLVEWQPMFYGTLTPDAVQFAPMARRIVAAERGEAETRFWFLGLEADDETLPLWAMRPAYRADVPLYRFDAPDVAGRPTWAFVEGPNFVNRSQYNERLGNLGVFDNTLVEFRPRHSLAGRAVDAAGVFEGDLMINGYAIRATVAEDDPSAPLADNGASAIGVAAAINDTEGLRVQARPGVGRFEGETITGGEVGPEFALVINAERIELAGVVAEGDADHRLQNAVNAAAPLTGVTASKTTLNVGGMVSTRLVLQSPDGRNITLEVSPDAATVTGLVTGTTRAGVILDHDAPIVVSGPNAVAAGLAVGESVADPTRWRVTARRVFCGAKGTL